MIIVNGWTLYAHPLFLEQLERLTTAVERAKAKDPKGYASTANAKLLAAMRKLMLETIPVDPARPEFRQGGTLGPSRKHWFRAKFYQQYRLFFRYHATDRIIVYAWINDEDSKRAYESSDDAYLVFRKMLDNGHPPEDWAALLKEASATSKRLSSLITPER